MAHQDYFTNFEPDWMKMGDPENRLTTRKQNLACLMWHELGANPKQWEWQAI